MTFTKFKEYLKPYIPTIIACCFYTSATGFISDLDTILKISLSLIMIVLYLFNRPSLDVKYIFFILYLPVNVFLTNPDRIFQSWERLAFFIVVFVAFSPLIKSNYAKRFRHKILMIILNLSTLLSFLSFFGYFIGINMMNGQESSFYDFKNDAGTFGGFFNHSMLLGPFAGVSACYMLYQYYMNSKNIYLFIVIILIGSLMLAASRIAFASTIVALVFLIYKYSNDKIRFTKIILSVVLISAITFPIWNGGLDRMESKQKNSANLGRFGTRTSRWENRFSEIEYSPIIGVGFSAVDTKGDDYDATTGGVEPGSSWLAVLSMTGIVGFAFVLSFFYCAYKNVKRSKNNESILLVSLLIFIVFHMIAEGYIFAGGSVLCVLAWLIVACCQDCNIEEDEISVFQQPT